MTDTQIDTVSSRLFLDAADLAELTETGALWFSLGDRRFELHTRPRPTTEPYAIRVTAEHLEALRTTGEIAFRRPWGRLAVSMTLEEAR